MSGTAKWSLCKHFIQRFCSHSTFHLSWWGWFLNLPHFFHSPCWPRHTLQAGNLWFCLAAPFWPWTPPNSDIYFWAPDLVDLSALHCPFLSKYSQLNLLQTHCEQVQLCPLSVAKSLQTLVLIHMKYFFPHIPSTLLSWTMGASCSVPLMYLCDSNHWHIQTHTWQCPIGYI